MKSKLNKQNPFRLLCIYKKHFPVLKSSRILKSKHFPNTECILQLIEKKSKKFIKHA